MDERTERLRDIFVDATGSETVTESQSESPGSLINRDETAVTAEFGASLEAMRERYSFETDLSTAAYARIARGFFADESDDEIAEALRAAAEGADDDGADGADGADDADDDGADGADANIDDDADDDTNANADTSANINAATVSQARFDLHLVGAADRAVPVSYEALLERVAAGDDAAACAAALAVDVAAIEAALPAARADVASARVNDRFRDEFRALFTDADLSESHAKTAREDGLAEATADLETDVSL